VVPACSFLFVPYFNNLSPIYGTLVATEGMRLAEGVLSPLSLANDDNNSGRYAYAPKSPPRRAPSSACSSPSHAAQAHARSGGGGRPRGVSFTSSASHVYSVTSKGKDTDKDKDSVAIANDFDQKAKKDKHSHHKGKGQLDSSSSAAGGRYTPLERHSERDEDAAAAAGKSEALQELIDVQNIAEVINASFFF
jgi:hypothetical protein